MDIGIIKLSEYLNPQYCPKLYLVMFDSLEAKTQLLHQVRVLLILLPLRVTLISPAVKFSLVEQ